MEAGHRERAAAISQERGDLGSVVVVVCKRGQVQGDAEGGEHRAGCRAECGRREG